MSDPRIDPRAEALGIRIEDNPDAVYHIVKVEYQDENQSGGQHHIWQHVADENGKPLTGIPTYMDWVGRPPSEDPPTMRATDGTGTANQSMDANLDVHKLNGPYFAYAGDAKIVRNSPTAIQSDRVLGMGLPEKHHVNFILWWKKGAVAPPPPPPPTGDWRTVYQDLKLWVQVKD